MTINILRIELTLRGQQVKDEIRAIDDYETYNKYLRRVDMTTQAPVKNNALLIKSAPAQLSYMHWLDGVHVKQHLPANTFYRHRRTILAATGVDIANPPPAEERAAILEAVDHISALPLAEFDDAHPSPQRCPATPDMFPVSEVA